MGDLTDPVASGTEPGDSSASVGRSLSEVRHFQGTCDVCGAKLALTHDFASQGIIDYGVTDDGRLYTWRRHYATAPPWANPNCARYSSIVYELPADRAPCTCHGSWALHADAQAAALREQGLRIDRLERFARRVADMNPSSGVLTFAMKVELQRQAREALGEAS